MLKKLFFISGLIPVFGWVVALFSRQQGDPIPLIYSLFVFAYFLKDKLKPYAANIPLSPLLKFYLLATLLGMVTDTFVFISDRTGAVGHHGNIFLNFLLSSFWYSTFTLAWTIVLKKYRFTLAQLFLTQGITGLLIEQQGAVFIQILQNPLAIIWGVYSMLVYSSFVAIPFLLLKDELERGDKDGSWKKYFLLPLSVGILILLLAFMAEVGGVIK